MEQHPDEQNRIQWNYGHGGSEEQHPDDKQNSNIEEEDDDFVVDYSSCLFPPGYRFVPTDEEVIEYLEKKINKQPLPAPNLIPEVDLYDHHPRKLTAEHRPITDNVWYFFSPRDKKYPKGTRPRRCIPENGYWKPTATEKEIKAGCMRRTLDFLEGKYREGVKTCWTMHEYTINSSQNKPKTNHSSNQEQEDMKLDEWVLCRVYIKKNELKKGLSGKEASTSTASFDHPVMTVNRVSQRSNGSASLMGGDNNNAFHSNGNIVSSQSQSQSQSHNPDASSSSSFMYENPYSSLEDYQQPSGFNYNYQSWNNNPILLDPAPALAPAGYMNLSYEDYQQPFGFNYNNQNWNNNPISLDPAPTPAGYMNLSYEEHQQPFGFNYNYQRWNNNPILLDPAPAPAGYMNIIYEDSSSLVLAGNNNNNFMLHQNKYLNVSQEPGNLPQGPMMHQNYYMNVSQEPGNLPQRPIMHQNYDMNVSQEPGNLPQRPMMHQNYYMNVSQEPSNLPQGPMMHEEAEAEAAAASASGTSQLPTEDDHTYRKPQKN